MRAGWLATGVVGPDRVDELLSRPIWHDTGRWHHEPGWGWVTDRLNSRRRHEHAPAGLDRAEAQQLERFFEALARRTPPRPDE